MNIYLDKKNKFYSYVKKNPVNVSEKSCADYQCFSPHNWDYRASDGKMKNSFRCNTREHAGCPNIKDRVKINKMEYGRGD